MNELKMEKKTWLLVGAVGLVTLLAVGLVVYYEHKKKEAARSGSSSSSSSSGSSSSSSGSSSSNGDSDYKVYEKQIVSVKRSNVYCKGMTRDACKTKVLAACNRQDKGCLGYSFTRADNKGPSFGSLAQELATSKTLQPNVAWDSYIRVV